MKTILQGGFRSMLRMLAALPLLGIAAAVEDSPNLWDLAREHAEVHRYSTLFTAHNMREHLADDAGIDRAIDWCRKTGVTKVYLESFRSKEWAKREVLEHARDRFREAGFEVSGCVTTTDVGKRSTGWGMISCYTDLPTQETVRKIMEFTAGLFDEIMIDDFWFTDCECADCVRARDSRTVRIGQQEFPVTGSSWEDYRCELMVRLSEKNMLGAARSINPAVKVIIKYPQWYDNFHERGYEVERESRDFDRIWVGTETRDFNDPKWGGKAQYEAFFIMRWLGGIGAAKCGGGWFDWLGTTEDTYLEQARQTILGGARESMLFCYGGLQESTGPKNVERLRGNLPELLAVAGEVRKRELVGVAACKLPNSHPEGEAWVYDFVGMLGVPLVPCHEFPAAAPAAFFPVHALKDPGFKDRLKALVAAGKPVLLTDGLVQRLDGVDLDLPNVVKLPVRSNSKSLLELDQDTLDGIRRVLLKPLGLEFRAPNRVALYPFSDGSWVIENFNDAAVEVVLNGQRLTIPARGWRFEWK